MKLLLLALNLLLLGGVIYGISGFFSPAPEVTLTVGKNRSTTPKNVKSGSAAKNSTQELSSEEAAALVVSNQIFSLTRCPDATSFGRGGSQSSMTLVGIYRIGAYQGAVIQQKRSGNNRRGPWGRNNNDNSKSQVYKQFFRVGEALENGYTVTAIQEDSVILSRGGGSLELLLERASTNTPATVAARTASEQQNRPTNQQIQQMMMGRQLQMLDQLVRQTRGGMNQNQNSGNRATTPGRGSNSNRNR